MKLSERPKLKLTLIIIITIIVTAMVVSYSSQRQAEVDEYYRYLRIPDIELNGTMLFYGNTYGGEVLNAQREGQVAYGELVGFVALSNIEDQPKNARQYQTIVATNRFDERGFQIFELYDTFKMPYVSPQTFDEPTLFYVADNNARELLLTNQDGWTIQIQKQSLHPRVTSTDAQGDQSYLLTDPSDFEDVMERIHQP